MATAGSAAGGAGHEASPPPELGAPRSPLIHPPKFPPFDGRWRIHSLQVPHLGADAAVEASGVALPSKFHLLPSLSLAVEGDGTYVHRLHIGDSHLVLTSESRLSAPAVAAAGSEEKGWIVPLSRLEE